MVIAFRWHPSGKSRNPAVPFRWAPSVKTGPSGARQTENPVTEGEVSCLAAPFGGPYGCMEMVFRNCLFHYKLVHNWAATNRKFSGLAARRARRAAKAPWESINPLAPLPVGRIRCQKGPCVRGGLRQPGEPADLPAGMGRHKALPRGFLTTGGVSAKPPVSQDQLAGRRASRAANGPLQIQKVFGSRGGPRLA